MSSPTRTDIRRLPTEPSIDLPGTHVRDQLVSTDRDAETVAADVSGLADDDQPQERREATQGQTLREVHRPGDEQETEECRPHLFEPLLHPRTQERSHRHDEGQEHREQDGRVELAVELVPRCHRRRASRAEPARR